MKRIKLEHDQTELSAAYTLRKGIFFCLISTLMYSFSNVTMRKLGVMGLENSWIIFLKEMVTITCLTPLILFWIVRGQYARPALKWVLCIFVGGFFCQYVGARLHLVAFDVVGLVVSIPLIQASTLVFSAMIGLFLLREKISRRCLAAMLVMLVAMVCLLFGPNQGTPEPGEQVELTTTGRAVLLGGLGAVVAGSAYSVHVVCLRMAGNSRRIPITLIAVQVTGVGALIFGLEFFRDHDWQMAALWENVTPKGWGLIILTGFLNMIGFLFQITGLRYTIVARAQMIAVAQIVISTIFGVLAFGETTNVMIWLGVSLTVLGIYVVSTPSQKELSLESR